MNMAHIVKDRGSLHLNCLIWFEIIRAVGLESLLRADVPEDDPELRRLVLGVQRSVSSGWNPVQEQATHWHFKGHWSLHVRKPADFEANSLRPYVPALLRVFRCHRDVQWWEGREVLMKYVSKYGESIQDHWLDDASSSWSAAVAMPRCWKPAAIEQALVLSREGMTITNVVAVDCRRIRFGEPEDAHRALYQRRDSSLQDISMLEWLRRFAVVPHQDVHRAVARRGDHVVAVGIRYPKLCCDAYFWTWLYLNKPHRLVETLCPDIMWKVGYDVKALATISVLMPSTWPCGPWVSTYLARQGHKQEVILTKMNEVAGGVKLQEK